MVAPAAVLWWPETLHHVADDPDCLADFAYVVLEELVDHRVVLISWPWPQADRRGRLSWSSSAAQDPSVATLDQELLRYQLYRPSRLQRLPRIGDVFAATRLGPGWNRGLVGDVRTLFEGPLYDISADAREAAKLAYQGAVATVRAPELADEVDRGLLARAGQRRSARKARQLKLSPPPERRAPSR